jgi:putative transposase
MDQDFAATGQNQKWGVDISYVWTREGWLYLAVVIDLFSRRVVGWAVGDGLHRELAINALGKAIVMRRPKPGLIHHSDRGSQFLEPIGNIPPAEAEERYYAMPGAPDIAA